MILRALSKKEAFAAAMSLLQGVLKPHIFVLYV